MVSLHLSLSPPGSHASLDPYHILSYTRSCAESAYYAVRHSHYSVVLVSGCGLNVGVVSLIVHNMVHTEGGKWDHPRINFKNLEVQLDRLCTRV